jgi:hypothetical protein
MNEATASPQDPPANRVIRRRSIVTALLLVALAVFFYITTIVRLSSDVALRNL